MIRNVLQIIRDDILQCLVWTEERHMFCKLLTFFVCGDCLAEVFLERGTVWFVRGGKLLFRLFAFQEEPSKGLGFGGHFDLNSRMGRRGWKTEKPRATTWYW
jgi:hypothetical protein